MDNAYSADLVVDSGLVVQPSGVEFDIRLPWYRALPLSVVEIASVRLDGQPVTQQNLRLCVNGKSFALADFPEQTTEFWFVLDNARIRCEGVTADVGTEHRVEVQLNLYPPYIPHLTWVTQGARTMRARGVDGARS
jgi:hypothetical protein